MNKQLQMDKTNFEKALDYNEEASGAFWSPETQDGRIEKHRKDSITAQGCPQQRLHQFTYPLTVH